MPENIIRALLEHIGEDPDREGLRETPERVMKAWKEWAEGYGVDPADVLKTFEDGAEGTDELVIVHSVPVVSKCVVGSTFIETPRGRVPIKMLRHGDLVYTMDPSTFELQVVPCENPRVTRKEAQLVQVHTDNDSLICTPDHKVLKTNGEWIEAQHLESNDRLASLYRGAQGGRDAGAGKHNQYTKAYPTLGTCRGTPATLSIQGERKAVVEHRFIKEYFDPGCYPEGRKLVTHHKDETTWNNHPDNLDVKTQREHNWDHNHGERLAHHEGRKKAAASSSGREDVREKRSASVKAYWDRAKQDGDKYREHCKSISKENHTVFGVEHLGYREDVYCMSVPGTHLFFANGIAAHNCEHHLADITGIAHVGYIPDRRIVGLSKLARLVDVYARRLQVQERMTQQIADALATHLKPAGVGVLVRASHACMSSRGVRIHGSVTTTSAMRGCMRDNDGARKEFMDACMMAERDR